MVEPPRRQARQARRDAGRRARGRSGLTATRGGGEAGPSMGMRVAEEQETATEMPDTLQVVRPRSPLIIGAVAYGILLGMLLITCLVIALRLAMR